MQQTASQDSLSMSLKGLFFALTQVVQDVLAIARLETRLAGVSLFAIVLLLFMSSLLCFSVWLSILLAICIELLQLGLRWALILLLVAGLNTVLLGITFFGIKRLVKNLWFTATRKQLRSNQKAVQEQDYAITTQETNPTA